MPHARKDCIEDEYKTVVRMVVDTVRDPTEPHQERAAEVKNVQLREPSLYSDVTADFLKEVEPVKSAVVEVMPGVPLNPAKMSVIRDRQDYYGVKKEEVLVKTRELSMIFPPTRGYEVAEWGMKVYSVAVESKSVKKSAVVEDMSGVPLSLTNDSVTDGSNFIDVQGEGMIRRASWVEDEVLKDAEDAASSNLCPGGVLDGCKSL